MEIIHSQDVKKILRFHIKGGNHYSFIVLNKEFQGYRDILKSKGVIELPVEDMDDKERGICEKEYINNIASLGFEYHSIEWWANPASEKNEHISKHYSNLCLFYRLIKTLKKYAGQDMNVFVVCSTDLFGQLKSYCQNNNINIKSLEKASAVRTAELCSRLLAVSKIMLSITAILMKKLYVSFKLADRTKEIIDSPGSKYVIRTWLVNGVLIKDGIYQDAYFGRLLEYAGGCGYNVIVLAGIPANYRKAVRDIKCTKQLRGIPEEFFLNYVDFLRLPFYFNLKVKLKEKVFFNGVDVTLIYEKEIANGYFCADYFKNLLRYFIAKKFALAVRFEVYIQTFENYAWEKLTILGIRETGSSGKILGFQHAFVSRNSFKYFPGESEKDIMPLPDRIITRGQITKDIMEKYGHYRPGILKVGCALRQEYLGSIKPLKRKRFDRVVVPLTMVGYESALIMKFLYASGLADTDIKVIIRCHPAGLFESFKKYIHFNIPDNFIVSNEKSVQEELSATDMVLYTWTTVAVEAMKMGLPVIYLDLLDPMYVDPLFECSSFKRTVRRTAELLSAMKEFYDMSDSEFYHEQEMAQKYLMRDFYPVTEGNLTPFMSYNNPKR